MPALDTIPKGTKTAGDARPSGVDLSGSILRRVSLSLRAEHAVLYALREDALEPAHSIGITPPACAINATAGCLEGMQPGSPALHWSALRMKIAASGRRLLDLARPELLIPIFLRDRLEGLLLLGP